MPNLAVSPVSRGAAARESLLSRDTRVTTGLGLARAPGPPLRTGLFALRAPILAQGKGRVPLVRWSYYPGGYDVVRS
jgi:hypothetical protein